MIYTNWTRLRSALLGSAAAALVAAPVTFSVAVAQDEAAADDAVVELEEVVVTGSRIRRAEYEGLHPTITIDSEFIDTRGFTNVSDALNELPSFGIAGNSPEGAQGITNAGANFVDFFGIGSQRTLTLLNGRRVVAANAPTNFNNASPGLQVDLNIIPTALIDRIEIISIGGAPIYGSDAIAGTINIILKEDFEGAEIDVQYGIASRGDAENFRIRGLVGGNFGSDRGNATLTVEYNDIGGLGELARDEFNRGGQTFQPTGGDCGSPRCLIDPTRVLLATFGGLPSVLSTIPAQNDAQLGFIGFNSAVLDGAGNILQFGPQGTLVPFDSGTRGSVITAEGGDGINLAELGTLRTPLERILISGNVNYDVTNHINLFVEGLFANTRATDLLSQAAWWTGFFPGESSALEFSVDNLFLTTTDRDIINANNRRIEADQGLTPDSLQSFFLSRNGLDLLDGENKSEMNLYRVVAGLRGDVDIMGNTWEWDVAYNIGRSRVDSIGPSINSQRLDWALDVAVDPDTGQLVCDVQLNPPDLPGAQFNVGDTNVLSVIEDCRPLNLFGRGVSDPEAVAFITVDVGSATIIQQQVISANVTGDMFELPAGPAGFAFGVVHRREQAEFAPDGAMASGLGRNPPVAGTAGKFNTYEVYGEGLFPIIRNGEGLPFATPFISDFELEGAIRFVDNSRAGNDTTWTAGGRLGLNIPFISGFQLRGNFTRSIRSPALAELFLPITQINDFVQDPCDASFVGGGPNPTVRRANCQALIDQIGAVDAFGNPIDLDTFASNAVGGSIQGLTGGNEDLSNEFAESWSIGAVFGFDFLPGFTAAIDWVAIDVDNAITELDFTSVAQGCFDVADFPNLLCSRMERDKNFQLTSARAGFENAGFSTFRGLKASFQFATDAEVLPVIGKSLAGTLSLDGNFFHLARQRVSVTGFDLNIQDEEIGRNALRFQLNFRYNGDRIGFMWQTRFVGKGIFDRQVQNTDLLGVSSYWVNNTTISYRIADFVSARVGIDNVFDTRPPFGSAATGFGAVRGTQRATYDFLGRFFRFGLNANF